jgi:hypothetical protein
VGYAYRHRSELIRHCAGSQSRSTGIGVSSLALVPLPSVRVAHVTREARRVRGGSPTAFSQTDRKASDQDGQSGHTVDPDLRLRILQH